MADLTELPKPAKSMQNGACFSRKKTSMPESPLPQKKEHSRLSRVPDHEGEKVKVSESHTLARQKGIRARA